MLVPGMALSDPGRQEGEIAGIDLNLIGAIGQIVLLAVALVLLQWDKRTPVNMSTSSPP